MLSDMYAYLNSITPITTIVGSRLYPHHIPQGITTFPVLTFQQISIAHGHHLDSGNGVAMARIQVDCWGNTLLSVETLGERVRAALQAYQGSMGFTDIHYIQADSEQDLHELKQDGSDNWLYRRSQDYLVKYTETVTLGAPSSGSTFTETGTGGVLFDGTASVSQLYYYSQIGSGGVLFDGTAIDTVGSSGPTAADILAIGPYMWVTAGSSYLVKTSGGTPSYGNSIERMTDRSGNGRHANGFLADPGFQSVGGYDAVVMNSGATGLIWANNTFDALTSGAEFFFVTRVTTGNAFNQYAAFGNSGVGCWYPYSGDIYDDFGSTLRFPIYVPTQSLTTRHIYHVSSTTSWTADLNGVVQITYPSTTVAWYATPFMTGDREVYDMIIFPPLTAPQRATVMTYLKNTWGTP